MTALFLGLGCNLLTDTLGYVLGLLVLSGPCEITLCWIGLHLLFTLYIRLDLYLGCCWIFTRDEFI